MISEPLYSAEFIGRRDELGFLQEAFRAACEARVRFVTIEGEAGIGKSRLVTEFCNALGESAGIVAGYCSEQVRAPYLPFEEIFERLDPERRVVRVAPAHEARGDEKYAYFTAVSELIRRESARRPLVLVIEDAQWADNASVELLSFLLMRLRNSRFLLVVTMRTDGPELPAHLAALRSTAARSHAATVQLRAMRRNEVRRLVQQSLAQRAPSAQALGQIEQLAEGNPLFAEELARTFLESGALTFDVRMPLTLQALLAERLSPFSEHERELLYRCAVIGESFSAEFLAAVCERPIDHILALLQRAVRAGLIFEHTGDPSRFGFRHALIRQALSERLVLGLAAPLHVRIAEELENAADADARAAELAYHWTAARVADKARVWNEAAARAAWSVFAYRDAIRFYIEALRWNYPPGSARAALYERIGTLLYIEGCGDEPAVWFGRCAEEYERIGNRVGAAHARLLEADQMWVDARTHEAARVCADAAVTLKHLGHAPSYAQALLGVARYAITLGDAGTARANLTAAKRACAEFDLGTRASWHEVSGETYAVCGDLNRAVAEFRTAARFAAQSSVSELIAQIENNFALAAFDLGELELAIARHQIAVDEAQRTGMSWRVAYSSLNYARTLMFTGRIARAAAMIRQALETGVTTATFKTKVASVGIPLALAANDRALLEACTDESALALAQQSGEAQRIAAVAAAFAMLRAAQGGAAEAASIVTRALHTVKAPHRAWELFVAAAAWGDREDKSLALGFIERASARPKVKRAYRLLFAALEARKHDQELARRIAAAARKQFDAMGDSMHAPMYDTLTGSFEGGQASKDAPGGPALTQRQLEIARLVCTGQTNREIAQALHISEHTVEHHVSSIFARLGLHSRAQLAHVMGRSEPHK